MIKALIFDMDGVVINSEPLHFIATKQLLKRYGKEFTWEDHLKFLGTTEEYTWSKLAKDLNLKKDHNQLMEEKTKIFVKLIETEGKAMKGALELLKDLKGKTLLALASNSPYAHVAAVLSRLHLQDTFDTILCENDVTHPKPHPEIYLKAAERLNVKPEECIVIEDSPVGIEAGKKARMHCIGLASSFQKETLSAEHVASDFDAIKSILVKEYGMVAVDANKGVVRKIK